MISGIISVQTASWVHVVLSHDVGRYYRKLYQKFCGIKLERPKHDEHITIISPKDKYQITPENIHIFCRTVELEIILKPATNNNAIWYPVKSEDIDQIRKSLGLGEPAIPLHYCIGYVPQH